jgi:type IV pilus assembly protein PilX
MHIGKSFAPGKQRGAVMAVSLLLLLVLTVLALTASQSTVLQERMAGNARDVDLAFQAAEAGLRDAEVTLADLFKSAGQMPAPCAASADCEVKERSASFKPDLARGTTLSASNTRDYATDGRQIAEVISDPVIYTELRGIKPDSLTRGGPILDSGVAFYTHTVRANGGTDTSTVVLQSIDAQRYPR